MRDENDAQRRLSVLFETNFRNEFEYNKEDDNQGKLNIN